MKPLCVASLLMTFTFALQAAEGEKPAPPSDELKALAQAQNQFALDLFAQLRKSDGNLFSWPEPITRPNPPPWTSPRPPRSLAQRSMPGSPSAPMT